MPLPHVFGKCAEAIEKKRVARISERSVCDKCSEAIENKTLGKFTLVRKVCDPSHKTLGARKSSEAIETKGDELRGF